MAAARGLYQRALTAFREAGDAWGSARSLTDLAYIDCEQGDHAAAHAAYREALEIFSSLGHRRGMARALEGFACLALAQGHAERALKLAAAAAHLRQLIGAPLTRRNNPSWIRRCCQPGNRSASQRGRSAWEEGFCDEPGESDPVFTGST